MFTVIAITNYLLEQGDPAGCGQSDSAPTLAEAIAEGCKVQEEIPEYDGRGPKSVSVVFADGNDGEDKGDAFEYYGEWTPEVTAACTLHITEAFNVGRTYANWGC